MKNNNPSYNKTKEQLHKSSIIKMKKVIENLEKIILENNLSIEDWDNSTKWLLDNKIIKNRITSISVNKYKNI